MKVASIITRGLLCLLIAFYCTSAMAKDSPQKADKVTTVSTTKIAKAIDGDQNQVFPHGNVVVARRKVREHG